MDEVQMVCEKCNKEFSEDWRRDKQARLKPCRFCCRECANSRIRTEETKSKISKTLTKNGRRCSCGEKLSHNNKSGICKYCKPPAKTQVENVTKWRKKKKIFLVEYKGGKCEICGYNKSVAALDFHHKDSTAKDFGISSKNIKSIERYKEEVDKCILVCANCHRELHEKKASLA